jgi:hypothetical protein
MKKAKPDTNQINPNGMILDIFLFALGDNI